MSKKLALTVSSHFCSVSINSSWHCLLYNSSSQFLEGQAGHKELTLVLSSLV